MFECENWTVKKTEHWRIDVFELWGWEDSWGSLGQQGVQQVNPKENQPLICFGRADAETEASIHWPLDAKKELTHWKRPWGRERLRAGREGDDKGWDG